MSAAERAPEPAEQLVRARFPRRIDQERILELVTRGWTPLEKQGHPLRRLQGQPLAQAILQLFLGPQNRFGAWYFLIFLQDELGQASDQPLLLGLYNRGPYPGNNWIEIISFSERITFTSEQGEKASLHIPLDGLATELFQYLSDELPPGGHMMIEYESPEQEVTRRSLELGIPPAATPLGSLLFRVGCGYGFRNWYFSEGGNEGPRKLQGFKALNEEHARAKMRELVEEFRSFLKQDMSHINRKLELAARRRAAEILRTVAQDSPEIKQEF
jgi:hypothetical protein